MATDTTPGPDDRAWVLAAYPGATARYSQLRCEWIVAAEWVGQLGSGETEPAAWADAARRLQQ